MGGLYGEISDSSICLLSVGTPVYMYQSGTSSVQTSSSALTQKLPSHTGTDVVVTTKTFGLSSSSRMATFGYRTCNGLFSTGGGGGIGSAKCDTCNAYTTGYYSRIEVTSGTRYTITTYPTSYTGNEKRIIAGPATTGGVYIACKQCGRSIWTSLTNGWVITDYDPNYFVGTYGYIGLRLEVTLDPNVMTSGEKSRSFGIMDGWELI